MVFTNFQIGHSGDLPRTLSDDYENDVEFLKKVHHVLLEVGIHNSLLVYTNLVRKEGFIGV